MKNLRLMRRPLAIAALLLLAACGFQPMYGKLGRDSAAPDTVTELNRVTIASIPDRPGQMLRNRLIDRFYHDGRPTDPLYDLTVKIRETETGLGIRRDATASRTRLDMVARYTLTRRADHKTLLDSTTRTSISFNQLDAQYATLTAREDARDRALSELSELITSRVALYFSTGQQTQQDARDAAGKAAQKPALPESPAANPEE